VLAADDHSGHLLRSSSVKQIPAASGWIDSHRFVRRSSSAWTNFSRIPQLAATGCYPGRPASLSAFRLSPHSAPACRLGWPRPGLTGSRRPPPGLAGLRPDLAGHRRDWPASARISPATTGIDRSRPDLAGHCWVRAPPARIEAAPRSLDQTLGSFCLAQSVDF
jgi:hypothetical protein